MSVVINGDTGISGVNGHAGAPALKGSDADSGIHFGTDTASISTAGTNRLHVDSSGNCGIGTESADGRLHVFAGSAGSVTANGNANDFVVETPGTGGISILTPDASTGYIIFGSPTSNEGAMLRYSDTGNNFTIGTEDADGSLIFRTGAGQTALTINNAKNLGLGDSSPKSRMMIRGDSSTTSAANPGTDSTTTLSGAIIELVNKSGVTDTGVGVVATGLGASGRYGAITFVDKTSDNNGTGGEIRFFTSAGKTSDLVQNMALTQSGDLHMGEGNKMSVPNNGASANSYACATSYGTPYYATDLTGISHQYTVRRGGTYAYWEHGCYGDNYYFTHGTSTGGASRPNLVSDKDLFFASNGSVFNSTGTFAQFSDVRIKENIVDANSQWNDIKALRLVNYNLIGNEVRLLGFVAQEVELTSPGLVEIENPGFAEGTDLSAQMKLVKTSIIQLKAVKALQEAMERIETLEQRLADAGIA